LKIAKIKRRRNGGLEQLNINQVSNSGIPLAIYYLVQNNESKKNYGVRA
jgi:hypothetical protein